MDRQYPPPIPPQGTFYPNGFSPMMPSDALQPHLHQLPTLSMESLGSFSDYDDPNRTVPPPQGTQRSRRRQHQNSEHVKHRRTRSGCYTCRQRRVKCDETHPVCDRCRKGKRECSYPGTTSSPTVTKSSRSGSRTKRSPGGSSPSGSEMDAEDLASLSAIPDEDEDGTTGGEPQSAVSNSRRSLDPTPNPMSIDQTLPFPEASTSSSRRSATRPRPNRTNSRHTDKSEIRQSARWASLPKDIKYYLTYHRENMSHHHYGFKYDGAHFLSTTFIEIALNNGNAALLYAIVAFAAYHHSVSKNDDKISIFLSYYNKSIAHLQQSLKNTRHSVVTLLTILQLATIEEFLGDWLNLMGHQRAAYQILTDHFTPQTIMQDETRRQIINWYFRFNLFAGILAGEKTTLDREWFAAALEFYQRQLRDRPNDLGARFEEYFATSRLLATDVTLLFAAKSREGISDDKFAERIQKLMAEFAQFGHAIETAFTDPSCFVKSFPNAPPPSDNDILDYRDPNFLYAGELSTMNFVVLDHWTIDLMFRHQLNLTLGQAPSPELTQIALKKCRMFEAIQFRDDMGPAAALGAQTSLGILALFLPKDQKHTMWCRRKFADIEKLGYVYPASFRSHMSQIWGQDVTTWWLPNGEGYPSTLRVIREFIEYRAQQPKDAWASGIGDMSGVFRFLHIDEPGVVLDDLKSAGTEGRTSP